jgi:hypothetical protein
VYSVRIRLAYLIPEFLPIRGKRARIYYHGIQPFCLICYVPGHLRQDCENGSPITWTEYVESLKRTGIPLGYFAPLESSATNNTSSSSLPSASTPRSGSQAVTREELRSFLQEFVNQSQSNAQGSAPLQVPIPVTPVRPIVPIPLMRVNARPGNGNVNPIPTRVTRSSNSLNSLSSGSFQDPLATSRGRGNRGRPRTRGSQVNSNRGRGHINNSPNEIPFSGDYFDYINDYPNQPVRGRMRPQNHAFGNAPPHYSQDQHPMGPRRN